MTALSNVADLHLLPREEIVDQLVSEFSKWSDPVWRFKMHTAGRSAMKAAFNFQIEIFEETEDHEAEYLTDAKWS